MAYILDNKKITSYTVEKTLSQRMVAALVDTQIKADFYIGPNDATKYVFPATKAPGPNYILSDVSGNGVLVWTTNSSSSSGNPSFNFKRITDSGTNYLLGETDYAIEIVSDTYNIVTLPTAAGRGGRVYSVSRASDNNTMHLTAQSGETIDGTQSYYYLRKYTHMTVMSNDVNKWYVL